MIGKVNDDFFKKAILPRTGAQNSTVVIGPRMGVDAAILRVGDQYMAVAEDPIFPGPTSTPDEFAFFTVHIGASDVAVMGIKPRFMTYSLLLPPGTSEDYISALADRISYYAAELGMAIVGGHTGFYGSVTVPTIGGITVWGWGESYLTPGGAQVGDDLIITKGAAIEATGILAAELGDRLIRAGVPRPLVDRAKTRLRQMSVVKEAGVAVACGGVHAMHDATEGGLFRGIWEVAEASGVGVEVSLEKVPLPDDIKAVCGHFQLDPYRVISEGTLVLACAPDAGAAIINSLKKEGIEAAVIGKVVPLSEGRTYEADQQRQELLPPPVDHFWEVFFAALSAEDHSRERS